MFCFRFFMENDAFLFLFFSAREKNNPVVRTAARSAARSAARPAAKQNQSNIIINSCFISQNAIESATYGGSEQTNENDRFYVPSLKIPTKSPRPRFKRATARATTATSSESPWCTASRVHSARDCPEASAMSEFRPRHSALLIARGSVTVQLIFNGAFFSLLSNVRAMKKKAGSKVL